MKEIRLPSERSLSHFKWRVCLCTWQNWILTLVNHFYVVYSLISVTSLLSSILNACVMNSIMRMSPNLSSLLLLVDTEVVPSVLLLRTRLRSASSSLNFYGTLNDLFRMKSQKWNRQTQECNCCQGPNFLLPPPQIVLSFLAPSVHGPYLLFLLVTFHPCLLKVPHRWKPVSRGLSSGSGEG